MIRILAWSKLFVEAFALQGVDDSTSEVYQVMREASVREAIDDTRPHS